MEATIISAIIIYLLLIGLYVFFLVKQIKNNEWKRQIYKNDIITVIIFGLTSSVLGGILTGLINAALLNLGVGISFSLLLNALIVGISVRKGYESYHVLYPTIALVLFLISLFFTFIAEQAGLVGVQFIGAILAEPNTYLYIFIYPVYYLFQMVEKGFDIASLFFLIFNLLFFVLAFFSVFKLAKGRRS